MDKETEKFIINILRQGTTKWSGRNECLNRGRRQKIVGKFKNGTPKFLWERKCDGCDVWHFLKDDMFEVDHIVEIGPFKGDWHDFVLRVFCGQDNLQALCHSCHSRKTSTFNSTLRYERKKSVWADKSSEEIQDALDSL